MSSLSILIVDDEQSNCENLADILELEGHHVTWFVSPVKALSHGGEHPYDLAILDLKMPELDGVLLLRELRVQHPDLNAILTTAYFDDDEISNLDQGLFEEILSKPIDIDSLIGRVRKRNSAG